MVSGEILNAYEKCVRTYLNNCQASERSFAVKALLDGLLTKISHLLGSAADVEKLFAEISAIIDCLQCDVEQTPLGRDYNYDAAGLYSKATSAKTLDEFMALATEALFRSAPAKNYFEKFTDENPYSGPAESYRTVVGFKNRQALSAIFSKLGLKRPGNETCFHGSIGGVSVFVSMSDEGKGAATGTFSCGQVEIDIVNHGNSRVTDAASTAARDRLEELFRKLKV